MKVTGILEIEPNVLLLGHVVWFWVRWFYFYFSEYFPLLVLVLTSHFFTLWQWGPGMLPVLWEAGQLHRDWITGKKWCLTCLIPKKWCPTCLIPLGVHRKKTGDCSLRRTIWMKRWWRHRSSFCPKRFVCLWKSGEGRWQLWAIQKAEPHWRNEAFIPSFRSLTNKVFTLPFRKILSYRIAGRLGIYVYYMLS